MSRIGLKPITLPAGVEVKVDDKNLVSVKGPKGELQEKVSSLLTVENKDGVVTVSRSSDAAEHRAQHGLARTLINNMVKGVTEGYEKKLLLVSTKHRLATMLRTSELTEDLNLTRARVSSTMVKLFAEKKVKPGLHLKERSKVKWPEKAEMIDVLLDTRESEKILLVLLRSLDFAFSEVTRTFQFRLSTM